MHTRRADDGRGLEREPPARAAAERKRPTELAVAAVHLHVPQLQRDVFGAEAAAAADATVFAAAFDAQIVDRHAGDVGPRGGVVVGVERAAGADWEAPPSQVVAVDAQVIERDAPRQRPPRRRHLRRSGERRPCEPLGRSDRRDRRRRGLAFGSLERQRRTGALQAPNRGERRRRRVPLPLQLLDTSMALPAAPARRPGGLGGVQTLVDVVLAADVAEPRPYVIFVDRDASRAVRRRTARAAAGGDRRLHRSDDFEGNEWLRRRSRPSEENSFERESSRVMGRPPWGRLTEVGNDAPRRIPRNQPALLVVADISVHEQDGLRRPRHQIEQMEKTNARRGTGLESGDSPN